MKRNRPYFSYSQFNTWNTSKKGFYDRYVLNKPFYPTKYMKFGSTFMKALEYDDYDLIPIAAEVEKKELFEIELRSDIKVGDTTVQLFGIIDSCSSDFSEVVEYKTGIHPWDEVMVDNNDQILFYAYLIYLTKGIIPKCKLIHVETYLKNDGGVDATGNVFTYVRKDITAKGMVAFGKRIKKAIVDIEEYEYLGCDMEDELAEQYYELSLMKTKIDGKIDALKSEIAIRIKNEGANFSETNYGTFSLQERKTYTFDSSELTELEKKVKALKAKEKKEGNAKEKKSTFVKFTINN